MSLPEELKETIIVQGAHKGRSLYELAQDLVDKGTRLTREGEGISQKTLGYKEKSGIPSSHRDKVPMKMLVAAIGQATRSKGSRDHPVASPQRKPPPMRAPAEESAGVESDDDEFTQGTANKMLVVCELERLHVLSVLCSFRAMSQRCLAAYGSSVLVINVSEVQI